jgi:hypothetical protein
MGNRLPRFKEGIEKSRALGEREMSENLPRFEVELVTNLSTNGVVFVRSLDNMNFKIGDIVELTQD